jgi:hypothetical protein
VGTEESETYPRIVARLNANWRVIASSNGIQWILQSRYGHTHGLPRWAPRYYYRSRDGLVHGCRWYAGEIGDALVILLRLPNFFAEAQP